LLDAFVDQETGRVLVAQPDRVGIVGLGVMGGAIARNLLAKGTNVVGHDLDDDRRDVFEAAGGSLATSPRDVAAQADIVLLLLPSAAALATVTDGPQGLVEAARTGLVVVEMSTLALVDKERLRERLEPLGTLVLDCPISGTGIQAERGDIVIYASGDETAVERCRAILHQISREVIHVGPFGSGSRMKFLANHLVAVHVAAAGEVLALARQAGVDPELAVEVLGAGAGSSRMLQIRGPMMASRRYSPASMSIRLFQKDLGIIREFARSVGASTPLFDATNKLFARAFEQGLAELDTAAVHETSSGSGEPGPREDEWSAGGLDS
jgi:3-hydroxyisobutyrate dehydrogenase-like beta-hydroxyacid dehydrogenase